MEMAERIKYTYVAGIWLEDIHAGLLWSTIVTKCRAPEYVAPSWSWACLTQLPSPHNSRNPPSRNRNSYSKNTAKNIAEILCVDVNTVGGDPYGQITAGILRIRGPSKNITYFDAKNFNSAGMEIYFDVGEEELDGGTLCMQILEGRPPLSIRSTSCILLKPTNQVEEYQRIEVAYIELGSVELEAEWEVREVTVI